MQADGEAADFGCEGQEVEADSGGEQEQGKVGAKAVVDGFTERVAAHHGKAAGHFHKKDEADGAGQDGPDEVKAIVGARLGGRGDGAGIEEAADAGNDAESDFEGALQIEGECTDRARVRNGTEG